MSDDSDVLDPFVEEVKADMRVKRWGRRHHPDPRCYHRHHFHVYHHIGKRSVTA